MISADQISGTVYLGADSRVGLPASPAMRDKVAGSPTPISEPRNILEYARASLIERIMSIEGRAASNPDRYRAYLDKRTIEELSTRIENLLNAVDGRVVPEDVSGREVNNPPIESGIHCVLISPARAEALRESEEANSRVPKGLEKSRSELPALVVLKEGRRS